MKDYKRIIISCLFAVIFIGINSVLAAETGGRVVDSFADLVSRSASPVRHLPFDEIVKTLDIHPGMSILDIGAGTGVFTLRFAKALNNTGKVYATELEPEKTEYIRSEGLKSGYANIVPVIVKKDGVDAFYSQHVFDLVFACDIFEGIPDVVSYFKQLRPSINKERGRLYLIAHDYELMLQSFADKNIDDFETFARNIISWKESPLYRRLSPQSREFIDNWDNSSVIPADKRQIIRKDINLIFSDRFFLSDMYNYLARHSVDTTSSLAPLIRILEPAEIQQVKWLFVQLDSSGVFEDKYLIMSSGDQERLNRLNYIFLFRMLKPNKHTNPFETSIYNSLFSLRKKSSIISKMESAGYRLVKEYPLPKRYFLEFERKY